MAMHSEDTYVVGVDYGTLSGRAVVVRVSDGFEMGSAVHEYDSAVMDAVFLPTGKTLPPEWALQDPKDYVSVLQHAVPAAIVDAGVDPSHVIGISTDFTACTMVPVLSDGTPTFKSGEFSRSAACLREIVATPRFATAGGPN